VIVSEVHFAPIDPDDRGRDFRSDQFEFVELYNRTLDVVDVSGWQVAGDIEIVLPQETRIEPRETLLVVAFDPSDPTQASPFRFVHGITTTVPMIGPYEGSLSDDQGHVQLIAVNASPLEEPASFVTVDELPYDTVPPWPSTTVTTGNSLTRARSAALGDDASNWLAAPTTPGIAELFLRQPGDSNEDGRFDQLDVVIVLQSDRYLAIRPATWREGDWNEDGMFNQADIIAAQQEGNYLQGAYAGRK
jgi:hypothetical protein